MMKLPMQAQPVMRNVSTVKVAWTGINQSVPGYPNDPSICDVITNDGSCGDNSAKAACDCFNGCNFALLPPIIAICQAGCAVAHADRMSRC